MYEPPAPSFRRDEPPPTYATRPSTDYGSCYGDHASEATPLVYRHEKPKNSRFFMLIFIGSVIAHVVIFVMWGPFVRLNIAIEQNQWEQELMDRRRIEQSRIRAWEDALNARQEREHQRMKKWDREWEDFVHARQEQERQREEQWENLLKARQERERQREEQWHREEEERQRLGLYWGHLEADDHCTAYNTRSYWARLLNTVPYQYNWLKPCQDIPIDIHGRSLRATTCEVKDDGSVYGHWRVNFDEPACTPYWDQFKDKGCTAPGSRRRRFEAHLENVHYGEDGDRLCRTAPHSFYGMHFDRPMTCAYWGKYGTFGIWETDDDNCG